MAVRIKKRYLFFFLLLAGFIALVAYRIKQNQQVASGNKSEKAQSYGPMRVNGMVVNPQTFVDSLSVKGSLEANEQVQIRSQVAGMVTGIFFNEGALVKKGQKLLQMDQSELNAQLSQAQTREQLAADNAQRAKLLLEKEAISQEEYQTAAAELKSLQSQTKLIYAQLAKTTILAPFSGTIGLRSISVGTYLTPETVVANLVNTNPIKLSFAVSEQYANQVKINASLKFTVAGDQRLYTAKVYAIEPGLDVATRTLQLRALADNRSGLLRPGAFANIQLPLNKIENAILIPTESIVPVQNGKKVFVLKNGKAKEVLIETSTRTTKNVIVTSGLLPGDTVLTTGVLSLKNGTNVVVDIPAATASDPLIN
jgi:membrane fusion protein (multidrug efflux system)